MINGVVLESRNRIANEKGDLLHFFRNDHALYKSFGEVYFSWCKPNVIKGWKKHERQTQNCVVPVGEVKFVLFDDREDSSTKGKVEEVIIGEQNYQMLSIPPQVWYAFTSYSNKESLIANCTDIPHDPSESIQRDLDDQAVPYNWKVDLA